ncbi:MAG: gamma-glutamyltransferase, partial [Rhodospirillaceae bacterium]|nr:gamma-glutamyltransferase [Rhodospirillaceae bacterium]
KAAKGDREVGLQAARNAFYKGDIAVAISDYHSQNGGWITMKDMADFNVTIEPPIKVERQGVTLYTCGPWCQGFSLAQMWAFIRDINLKELRHNSAEYIHILTEIIKLVLVDREVYLGDPEFVEIPTAELLSGNYASSRTSLITNDYIIPEEILWKGPRETIETSIISQDTSYMCAIDSNGLSASITPSDGSANTPVTPGWGINPSSRGSQSWAENGHPSCVAPWKRPRLTPNPAIAILKNGSVMPFGTPGADVQTQAMLQVLLNISEFQIPPQKAVELPRFASYDAPDSFEPHTAFRNLLKVENDIDEITVRLLREKGHVVETWPSQNWKAGAVCAIIDEPRKRLLRGAADPRRPCLAMGR